MSALLFLLGTLGGCRSSESDSLEPAATWAQTQSTHVEEAATTRATESPVVTFKPREARPGETLRAHVSSTVRPGQPGLRDLKFRWYADGRRVGGEGPSITVPGQLRRGDRIDLEVVWQGPKGRRTVEESVSIANRVPRIREISLESVAGSAGEPGYWRSTTLAEDPDDDEISFRYEWSVAGSGVVSRRDRLTQLGRQRGDVIGLKVWPRDAWGEGVGIESAPFLVGNTPPEIRSSPPDIDAGGVFNYTLDARDPDGDRDLQYRLIEGPREMRIGRRSGALVWDARRAPPGEHIVEVQVDDGQGGSTRQRFIVSVRLESDRG